MGTPANVPVSARAVRSAVFCSSQAVSGVAASRRGFTEYVRMAADHLVGDGSRDVGEAELAGFLGHACVIDDLEQQVAEFVRQREGSRRAMASATS